MEGAPDRCLAPGAGPATLLRPGCLCYHVKEPDLKIHSGPRRPGQLGGTQLCLHPGPGTQAHPAAAGWEAHSPDTRPWHSSAGSSAHPGAGTGMWHIHPGRQVVTNGSARTAPLTSLRRPVWTPRRCPQGHGDNTNSPSLGSGDPWAPLTNAEPKRGSHHPHQSLPPF